MGPSSHHSCDRIHDFVAREIGGNAWVEMQQAEAGAW
jgi:hypothetical protein